MQFDPPYCPDRWKCEIFKIQDGGGRHLENRKIAIARPRFNRFWQNLARWNISILLTARPLKIWNVENPKWRRPPSWKIDKSSYFDLGLTDFDEIWHGEAFRTRRARPIHKSSFLWVNFAYANSYVRSSIYKTFLRTKKIVNSCVHNKYTHDLSCQRTEIFRNYSELKNYSRNLFTAMLAKCK